MTIFTENQPAVSKIKSVILHDSGSESPSDRFIKYGGALYSYELIYFIDMDNITQFNGQTLRNRPDSVEYLPKGVLSNAPYVVERLTHGRCIDIFFDTSDAMPALALNQPAKSPQYKNLFMKLYKIWQSKSPGYYANAMSVFYAIISLIQQDSAPSYVPKHTLKKLEKSIDYLNANYLNHDFSYKTLADLSGFSYSYFKQLFIRQFKVPPQKFVALHRLGHARELLSTQRYSVSAVAELCGFENVCYFSNVFKKQTGFSPKEYQKFSK